MQVNINIDFTQEQIDAFATWMGKTDGDSLQYVIDRIINQPFSDLVIQFNKDILAKQMEVELKTAISQATSKINVSVQ